MKKKYLSKKEVEHVAWLAHIEISDKEKTLFTGQFNEILDYFKTRPNLTRHSFEQNRYENRGPNNLLRCSKWPFTIDPPPPRSSFEFKQRRTRKREEGRTTK